jgi:hypothetical protein
MLMGQDPICLDVLLAINLQISFMTPPFRLSLFYLRAAARKEITTPHIYRGVVPFIGLAGSGYCARCVTTRYPGRCPSIIYCCTRSAHDRASNIKLSLSAPHLSQLLWISAD